jgi:hypothetical protein
VTGLRRVVEAKAAELGYRPGEMIDDHMQIAEAVCEYAGHEWGDAGGGLLICTVCEAEKWADDASLPTNQPPPASAGEHGKEQRP